MKIKFFAFLLAFSMLIPLLSGCGKGIAEDEAKAHINSFFDAVEAGDYEMAATYLHPERPTDLEAYFSNIKEQDGVDFSAGVEIDKYTGFSSALYDSSVEGSTYSLTMKATVGDAEVKIEAEIVRNDNGYGIYNLDITP